jgi:excisionase family DNA binding protein
MQTTRELLTLIECQRITKRKVATWRKDIREKKIPYVRIGRQVRVPREFVERMIADGWREPVLSE